MLTGVTTRAEAEAASDPAPVAIADDLHALLLGADAVADRQSLGRRRSRRDGCCQTCRRPSRELGLEHHVERTRSLEHARELARGCRRAGETAVALGGDGLIGAVADALKHSDGVLGVLPGGRGNDFARVLGIPLEPRAACSVLANGEVRELDLGQVGATTFIGIASCGFDSEANRIANETRARTRQPRLRLRRAARAGRLAAGAL